MFCANCGATLAANARFCAMCGRQVVYPTPTSSASPMNPNPFQGLPQSNYPVKTSKASPLKKIIAVILVLVVAVTGFAIFNKSDEQRITDRIHTLEAAYNEGDTNKLVSCFDRQTQMELKAVIKIGSSVLGVDVSDLFRVAVGLSPTLSSFTGDDTTVSINIKEIRVTGKTAQVDVSFRVGAESQDCTFPMIKSGMSWLINLSG